MSKVKYLITLIALGVCGGTIYIIPYVRYSFYTQLTEAMNTQIRALTKGDITKEQQVLQMDVHRALTELDAQAREYEELKKHAKS